MGTVVAARSCCCASEGTQEGAQDAQELASVETEGVFLQEMQLHQSCKDMENGFYFDGGSPNMTPSLGPGNTSPTRRRLLNAVRQENAPGVLQLVAEGADLLEMGEALRLAVHRGSAVVVRELVAVGLSVNDACPRTGLCPLHIAAASGDVLVCELLLDALADVQQAIAGSTPLDVARKMGNIEVEEVLQQHVATLANAPQTEGTDLSHYIHAHVLPRVTPDLSKAIVSSVPSESTRDELGDTGYA